MDPTLILGGMKLLGGLFGRKPDPTPASNLLSQAQGAREAADKYGFNPLTMLQYGQTGGAMGGSAPLASAELLSSGLGDITDVVTGEKARRDASNRLELELGKLKLEQLRAGGIQVQPSAVGSVGTGVSPLGRRAATVGTPYVSPSSSSISGVVSGVPRSKLPAGVQFGPVALLPEPTVSDAEDIESRYGDIAQSVIGMGILAADLGYATRKITDRAAMVAETNRRQEVIDNPPRPSDGLPPSKGNPWLEPMFPRATAWLYGKPAWPRFSGMMPKKQ